MVVLSFSTLEKELLDGSKKQTVRENIEYWSRFFTPENDYKLHIHWRNPRIRHPDHYFMGMAEPLGYTVKKGIYFTLADATKDGFLTTTYSPIWNLWNWLSENHNLTLAEVQQKEWIICYYDWLNGYPKKGGNP